MNRSEERRFVSGKERAFIIVSSCLFSKGRFVGETDTGDQIDVDRYEFDKGSLTIISMNYRTLKSVIR